MTERLKAAIRLLYPDDMTPTARRILLQIIEEEAEAVPTGAASDVQGGIVSTFKAGDKVIDITEGIEGEVIEAEPLTPFPGIEMDLIPVLWEHGHVVYTDASYLSATNRKELP